MQTRIKIGELKNGRTVEISKFSPNEHILLTGTSGSGKSTRLKEIIEDCHVKGRTVIVFDVNGSDFVDYDCDAEVISAIDDGMNINFFHVEKSKREIYVNHVSYVVESFANVANLGVRQERALRDAVEFAINNKDDFANGMEAMEVGLRRQNSSEASGVLSKFWGLLQSNIFRTSKKKMILGAINVLTFSQLNPTTQRQAVELLLCELWRKCRLMKEHAEKVTVVIDEFQYLSLRKNSVLLEMLREARKYDVNLVLSTQTTTTFSKEVLAAINLTGVQLYFRPAVSDMKKTAELICPEDKGKWVLMLKTLKIGESVVNGNFSIGEKDFDHPIIIRSAYRNNGNNMLLK